MADGVDPAGRPVLLQPRQPAGDDPGQHDGLEAELPDGVLELVDGLLGREGRDARHRFEAIAEVGVDLGVVAVEGPGHGPAQLVVGEGGDRQAVGRVQQGEVDAELIEAVVQEIGEHGRRPVERVLGGDAPPGRAGHAEPAPLRAGRARRGWPGPR